MIGQTLGHYRIEEKIGAGGMGEVYRARDERLGRDVAIKVLPEAFARDPERLARFEREAHLLAALNHPNIAAIYGLEEFDRIRFLVLELVSGETLTERLGRGALPVEEALTLCRQVAEALEAAHEKGIIHRDLKPGNVKVTPEGKVKVLDFGLAKAFAGEAASADLSKSPTISEVATRSGVLLGTAAYMSPEQARGRPLDKRTDIWAFGCVLYEALTARHAFRGETVSDTLAKILEREPEWATLPANTPPPVRGLLRRCLQKDPARRLHDIADARLELDEALTAPAPALPTAAVPTASAPRWRRGVWFGLAGLLLGAFLTGIVVRSLRPAPTPRPVARLAITLPPTQRIPTGFARPLLALSPDGTRLVYVASRGGPPELYLRPLGQLDATPFPGTEGASGPFFSHDGQWVGFFAGGKLKKVSIHGGTPMILCDAPTDRGASWGPDDTILFAPTTNSGLWRVSASGGKPQIVTTPNTKERELSHRWPEVLPGGDAALFTLMHTRLGQMGVALLSLKTGEWRTLVEEGSLARYVPTGHLVYSREDALLALPFDLARLRVTGSPVPVLEGIMTDPYTGAASFAFSGMGALVYVPGNARAAERNLVWVDRKGAARPLAQARRPFVAPRLSPDGQRLVVEIVGATPDVWLYELGRETLTRLTFDGYNSAPIWTPDGKRVTFASSKAGTMNLYWKDAHGSEPEERLTTSGSGQFPGSWSPDGRMLVFRQLGLATGSDIWVLPLEGERLPRPFLATNFDERWPGLSPDGRWLAYVSNESGRDEVYVQPFPGLGSKWQISTEGGTEPVWNPNGRELFYRNGDKMMVAAIQTKPAFTTGTPRVLFEGGYDQASPRGANYDVTADGQRFVMIKGGQAASPTQLNVVLDWFDELNRRVPAGKK